MARSSSTIRRRRRSNEARISSTAVRSPVTAARAARWDTLATLLVPWDCRLPAALMRSSGPIIQPTLQPVMAYVLATPLTATKLSAISGTRARIEWWTWSS